MLKIFMMLVYQTLKLTYMRRRRRQERWYQESVNRIRRYSRWRSRRQQRMLQSLISELSRPKTVVRSVWSRQRSGSWWDVIVEGGFEEDDWTSNFRMSQRTFAISLLAIFWSIGRFLVQESNCCWIPSSAHISINAITSLSPHSVPLSVFASLIFKVVLQNPVKDNFGLPAVLAPFDS